MAKETLTQKITLDQQFKIMQISAKKKDSWQKRIVSHLMFRSSKEASEARIQCLGRREIMRNEIRKIRRKKRIMQGLMGYCKDLSSYSE